jgi:NAD(P)-dependent dehydrogenase (short-subunit alcohol dehydrogenase family)
LLKLGRLVETRSLDGQVVLVTGATSGIGAACARALAAAGARVVAGGRRDERLQKLADELGRDRVLPVRMDVRSPADSRRFADAAVSEFGRVDALVASAGIGAYGGILDHSDDVLATMIDTNVSGTIWPIRAVVPYLLDKNGTGTEPGDAGAGRPGGGQAQQDGYVGDIVIVASVAGLRGGGHEAVYAATKSAQIGLAGALDRELAPRGIRVTSICPAVTRTEFAMGCGRTPDMPGLDSWLEPDDVAGAVLTVLRQPRRMRTQLWSMWSMSEVG